MNAARLPTLRVIHNLARSGGTLLARCIASMRGVALLSEIHPEGTGIFSPLEQAHRWYGLLDPDDRERLAPGRGLGFADAIDLVAMRARARGLSLVVRDWGHLDYHGVPFVERPGLRPRLTEVLAARFAVRRIALVREPAAQWSSLRRLPMMRGRLDAEQFLTGYAHYARLCAGVGYVRYEDLTGHPDESLATVCAALEIEFDPGYRDRWWRYLNVTGNVDAISANRRVIAPSPPPPSDPDLVATLQGRPDLAAPIRRLGYLQEGRAQHHPSP